MIGAVVVLGMTVCDVFGVAVDVNDGVLDGENEGVDGMSIVMTVQCVACEIFVQIHQLFHLYLFPSKLR